MCSDLKLLDTIALQNKIITNNALVCSNDNRYCIIVEDGLYVLYLCGLMDNNLPTMSLKKLFVKTTEDFALSSHLGIDINPIINDLPQFELYEAILRLDTSEELNQSTPIKQQPIQAKWSPLGLIGNEHCALASLTNTGTLNVFVHTVNEVELEDYVSVTNISKLCVNFFKKDWTNFETCSAKVKYAELKARAEKVTATAFTWSNLITEGDKKFCLLIVGHLNGGITIWKFDAREANVLTQTGVNLVGNYETGLKKITALHWQQSGKNGLLVIGDLEGRAKAVSVTEIHLENVVFGNELFLWSNPDNIKIDQFQFLIYNKLIFVLIVKQSFLLVCLVNESGELLDIHNFQAGNFQITGIEHFEENIFLILTYTGVLKELKLSCENSKIKIDWRPLYVDFKWSSYRTHGLIVSSNKVFIAVLVSMYKLKDIRRSKDPIRLLIFMNMGRDPLAVLMKNNTDSLATYWDCLEILRLDGLVERKLPCDGLPAGLDYDKLSLIQLKTCLWLAKSSEMMYNKMYTIEEYNILRYDEFKYIVKIKLAVDHMQHLLELIADGTELTEFHMQSLEILNTYLKETIIDNTIPSLGLGKNMIDELYDVISTANELEYPPPPKCLWCKENIIGLSCVPSHVDTRCTISFMPITGLPYYKCQFCESVIHNKLSEVYSIVLCSYCDVTLDLVSFITDENNDIKVTKSSVEEIKNNFDVSCCSTDCNTETVELTEIEDHAFKDLEKEGKNVNLVWVSSSEGEDEDNDNDHSRTGDFNMEITTEQTNIG